MSKILNILSSKVIDKNEKIIIVSVISVVAALLIIGTILAVYFTLKKKKNKELQNEIKSFSTNLFNCLGGKENIQDLNLHASRLEVSLINKENIEKDKIIDLKIGASITNNIIKISLKENSKDIYKELKKKMKGE